MLKYWRILILIVVIIGAMLSIGLKAYPHGKNGVEVVYVSGTSPARDVLEQGMIITQLNGEDILNVVEWNTKIENLTGPVNLRANGKDYNFEVNGTLGIDVIDIERTNLNFGLDLRGGTRIILKPKENATKEIVEQVIATLQTRANIYGLREMNFHTIGGVDGTYYIQIDVAGIRKDIVDELLSKQGKFDAKVTKPVTLIDGSGTLIIGEDNFHLELHENNSINVNGNIIQSNETFTLSEIEFQYLNTTENTVVLLANVYEGKDIELVYTDSQRSGVIPRGDFYSFYFVVLVSTEGAQRFADVTTGIPSHVDFRTGERYLDSEILLFLDGQLVSQLQISADLGGVVYQSPQIQGSRSTLEDAIQEKLRLQTILRSGALPTTLETVSVDVISPTLGTEFFRSMIYAGIFAAVAVLIIVFLRYRSFKVAIPLVLIGMSEVLIILGIASTGDSMIWGIVLLINFLIISMAWWKKEEIDVFAWVGAILIPLLGMASWTIDLPAIGGIIAALGTGVDQTIVIADETLKGNKREEKTYTIREKIKRAFFIIFGAAATTIAAMFPLMFLGIGLVRGFAITTIVGVLVGILITRPAYAKIIERVAERRQ